jgi:hypothetical protein
MKIVAEDRVIGFMQEIRMKRKSCKSRTQSVNILVFYINKHVRFYVCPLKGECAVFHRCCAWRPRVCGCDISIPFCLSSASE